MNAFDQVFFAEEPTTDGPTRLGRMIVNVLGVALYAMFIWVVIQAF